MIIFLFNTILIRHFDGECQAQLCRTVIVFFLNDFKNDYLNLRRHQQLRIDRLSGRTEIRVL